jgi:uncharacterized protein
MRWSPFWKASDMWRMIILSLMSAVPAMADVASVVNDQIRPGYKRFASATAALAAVESCAPADLQPAYQSAFDAWMAVAHLHLGPGEDKGRSLAIAFWPDPKGLGAKAQRGLMLGDATDLTPERFAEQSVAARGLMGLERLLYPADPWPADPCPLIHATADDLARMAADIDAGWKDYGDALIHAGQAGNTQYLSEDEAKQELLTQLVAGLEYLADERIGRPLGSFDKPYPTRAEARLAGRSLRNVQLSLAALRDLATGLVPGSPATGAAFDRAMKLAEDLNDPILAGVADPQTRLKVEILQQAIWAARDAAISELAPALGVELGFNAADGD